MGTPDDLMNNGLAWRVQTYYDMPQGGACISGVDAGNINVISAASLRAKQLPMTAGLSFSVIAVDTAAHSAEISVAVSATNPLPEGVVLNVLMEETTINWMGAYDFAPLNGQTVMHNVACGFISDTLGFPIPAMASGEVALFTGTASYDPAFHNPDSLRIVAILQVAATREMLSAARMAVSPFPSAGTPVLSRYAVSAPLLGVTAQGADQIVFATPFADAQGAFYDLRGCRVGTFDLAGTAAGQRVSIARPVAAGICILEVVSRDGSRTAMRVPLQ